MGIRDVVLARNLGLAMLLSVSVLWAQQTGSQSPASPAQPSSIRTRPIYPGSEPLGVDPLGSFNRGISGRIRMLHAPSAFLRLELYRDMMLVGTTMTDGNGAFRFEGQQHDKRYEIRVDLGNGYEYVEDVDFFQGVPATIIIRPERIRRTKRAGNNPAGGAIISVASLNVPKKAAKELRKARKAARRKKYEEALGRLQKATEIYPKYAEAFNEMGRIYRGQNQKEEASRAFEQAIAADPEWVRAYVSLASLQMSDNQPQQLLETSNKILQLYPTLGPGHFFHSYANLSLGRLEEAEKSALQADRHEHRQLPQIHLLLAQIYRQKGKLEEGEKQLRTFLQESPKAPNADQVRAGIAELQQQAKAQLEQPEQ